MQHTANHGKLVLTKLTNKHANSLNACNTWQVNTRQCWQLLTLSHSAYTSQSRRLFLTHCPANAISFDHAHTAQYADRDSTLRRYGRLQHVDIAHIDSIIISMMKQAFSMHEINTMTFAQLHTVCVDMYIGN